MNINISPESNDELKVDYLNLMAQMGFVSCINEYSGVNNNSATTIDHIFIKNSCTNNIRPIILESCVTDHYITLILEENCKTIKSEIPNEKTNIDIKILRSLAKEKQEIIFEENDVNNCANNLHNILNNLIINSNKKIVNNTVSRKRKLKPWITTGLITSIRRRDKLGKMVLKNLITNNFLNYYKKYKNKLCSLIRYVRNEFYKKKITNITSDNNRNNTKQLWNVIGELINTNAKNNKPISQIIFENK